MRVVRGPARARFACAIWIRWAVERGVVARKACTIACQHIVTAQQLGLRNAWAFGCQWALQACLACRIKTVKGWKGGSRSSKRHLAFHLGARSTAGICSHSLCRDLYCGSAACSQGSRCTNCSLGMADSGYRRPCGFSGYTTAFFFGFSGFLADPFFFASCLFCCFSDRHFN